jgi:hypothetical protein
MKPDHGPSDERNREDRDYREPDRRGDASIIQGFEHKDGTEEAANEGASRMAFQRTSTEVQRARNRACRLRHEIFLL